MKRVTPLLTAFLVLFGCAREDLNNGGPGRAVAPEVAQPLATATTTLVLTDTGSTVASAAQLVATVRRFDNGRPIAGLTVSFWIDDRLMGTAITRSTGQAFLFFNTRQLFRAGLHSSRAKSSSNAAYSSSSDFGRFNVNRGVAYFKSPGLPFVPAGTTKRLTWRMADKNNDPIANRRIYLSINGGLESSYTTSSTGSFEFAVRARKGNNTVRIRFTTGDSYFNAKTQTSYCVVGT